MMMTKRNFSRGASGFGGAKRPSRSPFGRKRRIGGRDAGANKKRFGGDRIDYSRFIQKGVYEEEKPYVATHTFADFPLNEQIKTNILRAGYIHPRPIQERVGRPVVGTADPEFISQPSR